MKKLLTLFILGMVLFSLSNVFALEGWGTGKQNQNFTITQTCNDATYITISTIQFPDKSVQVINTNMTSTGSGAFQYNQTNNIQLGRYDVCGISDGCEQTFCSYYEITSSGFIENNKIPIFLLIFAVVLLVIGYIWQIPPIGFFSGILFMMVGIYLMIYGFGDIANLYTQSFSLIVIGFGMLMLILSAYSWLED